MDKIKHPKLNLSLRKSLMLYIVGFAILALVLSITTSYICSKAADNIYEAYQPSGEKYYLTNEQGRQLGDGAYIGNISTAVSPKDEQTIALLGLLPGIATPVYSAVCIIAAALLFYKNKLKRPLIELGAASEKISNNDLGFSIRYDSKDEMGQLCNSFETMRAALADNFSEMWRQVEDRKQLNAAFAHDLRTPLTVLKGYNEMLQISESKQTKEIAGTMGKHISRMEAYVASMSNLRRLEDTQPKYETVSLQPFLAALQESAQIVCTQNKKTLHIQNKTPACEICIDSSFVTQVCDNLLSNAVRYALTSVRLSFSLQDNGLEIEVSDDGKGFDKDIADKAVNPYFTEESDRSEHFGLGLYICKLLCEHHGGYLKLDSASGGAKISAFFKSPAL